MINFILSNSTPTPVDSFWKYFNDLINTQFTQTTVQQKIIKIWVKSDWLPLLVFNGEKKYKLRNTNSEEEKWREKYKGDLGNITIF